MLFGPMHRVSRTSLPLKVGKSELVVSLVVKASPLGSCFSSWFSSSSSSSSSSGRSSSSTVFSQWFPNIHPVVVMSSDNTTSSASGGGDNNAVLREPLRPPGSGTSSSTSTASSSLASTATQSSSARMDSRGGGTDGNGNGSSNPLRDGQDSHGSGVGSDVHINVYGKCALGFGGQTRAALKACSLVSGANRVTSTPPVPLPSKKYTHVADLSPRNDCLFPFGLGIYHSGLEVHGVEYAYGGHDYPSSGIFETAPRDAPAPAEFRASMFLGRTNLSAREVAAEVSRFDDEYRGDRYHLLQRNCNHFVSDLAKHLTNSSSPGWVNRLAWVAMQVRCLLPDSIVPPLEESVAPPRTPRFGTAQRGKRAAERLNGVRRDDERRSLLAPSGITMSTE